MIDVRSGINFGFRSANIFFEREQIHLRKQKKTGFKRGKYFWKYKGPCLQSLDSFRELCLLPGHCYGYTVVFMKPYKNFGIRFHRPATLFGRRP